VDLAYQKNDHLTIKKRFCKISIMVDICNYMNFRCCKVEHSANDLEQTLNFLKVISEPNRLRILCILQKQEMCVCDIWQCLDLSQNLTSHHLRVLRDFHLVKSKKEGTKVIYSINAKIMNKNYSLLSHYINNHN
jgi:DNA-binding transcriptional ArsR family regulator